MKKLKIVIEGNPVAKARVRLNIAYKHFYNTQVHEKVATQIYMKKAQAEQQVQDLFKGPVFVWMQFHIPKRARDKRQGYFYHQSKPDLDNLMKWYLDCANGILWKDDSIVAKSIVEKIYAENPLTIMEIEEIDAKKED